MNTDRRDNKGRKLKEGETYCLRHTGCQEMPKKEWI